MIDSLLLLKDIRLIAEFFLGVCIMNLMLHCTLLRKFSYELNIISILNLGIMILSFSLILIIIDLDDINFFNEYKFNDTILYDYIGHFSKSLVIFSSIIFLILIRNKLNYQKINNFEYILLILISILGIMLLCCSSDLMTAYLSIELQSLSFYILASFKRRSTFSVDAGLKYFIIGSLASSLFLFGTSLIYGITGSLNFEDFKDLFFWLVPGGLSALKDLDSYYANQTPEVSLLSIIANTSSADRNEHHRFLSKRDVIFLSDEINRFSIEECQTFKFALFDHISGTLTSKYVDYFKEDVVFREGIISDFTEQIELKIEKKIPFLTLLTLELRDATLVTTPEIAATLDPTRVVLYAAALLAVSKFLPIFLKEEDFFESYTFNDHFDINLLYISLLFILIALFIKLALVPFHLWLSDIYENSPTTTSMFFAVIPKIGIIILLLRLFYFSFYYFLDCFQYIISIIAVSSVLFGALSAIDQRRLKTIMAYSSIGHMGYVLLSFNSGTFEGLQMLYLYMIVYILSGLSIWSLLIFFKQKNKYSIKNNSDLSDLALLKKSNNTAAFVFSVILLSIAGFPPFIGFFSKMGVFLAIIQSSMYIVACIAILCSVLSTFYYVRIIKVMYFENLTIGKLYYPLFNSGTTLLSIFFLLTIYLFFYPTHVYLLTYKINYIFYV